MNFKTSWLAATTTLLSALFAVCGVVLLAAALVARNYEAMAFSFATTALFVAVTFRAYRKWVQYRREEAAALELQEWVAQQLAASDHGELALFQTPVEVLEKLEAMHQDIVKTAVEAHKDELARGNHD